MSTAAMEDVLDEDRRSGVASVMSKDKIRHSIRQVASTLAGGPVTPPGMTAKAYLLLFVLWVFPLLGGSFCSFAWTQELALVRLEAAGLGAGAFVIVVDIFKWLIRHRDAGRAKETHTRMWFSDYDDVDFSRLLSADTCRALLPPRRSWLHAFFGPLLAFALLGSAAAALAPPNVAADLGCGVSTVLVWVLIVFCFFTVTVAQFGITVGPPLESAMGYQTNPFSLSGLIADHSRPLLVLALLLPVAARDVIGTPPLGMTGACLRMVTATLPWCWALGIVPQLDVAAVWLLDQLEVDLFGGSPPLSWVQLSIATMNSAAGVGAFVAAIMISAVKGSDHSDEGFMLIGTMVACCIGPTVAATLLLLTPIRGADCCCIRRHSRLCDFATMKRASLALLKAACGAAVGVGMLSGIGGFVAAEGSLKAGREDFAMAWMARLFVEQVVALLCLCLHFVTTCWPQNTCNGKGRLSHLARMRRTLQFAECLACVLLIAHCACYDACAVASAAKKADREDNFTTYAWMAFEAILFLRALRVVFVDTARAAYDAWFAGMIDAVIYAATTFRNGPPPGSTMLQWSMGVRLLVSSVGRQRIIGFVMRLQFSAHLTWAACTLPKLRHKSIAKLVVANIICFPLFICSLGLSAAFESPLLALFTLPCFLVANPRPRHLHPEFCREGAPSSKGDEGIFYDVLTPSLLDALKPLFRCGRLSSRVGSVLLCRSHERLTCLVRILSAGYGWVNVELRGLELQEPTSCHHVEAARIDDAFTVAFGKERTEVTRRGGQGAALLVQVETPAPLFVLTPVCTVQASTYELTRLSLAGLLDNRATMSQVHKMFLKSLAWVFGKRYFDKASKKAEMLEDDWFTYPLRLSHSRVLAKQLRASTWMNYLNFPEEFFPGGVWGNHVIGSDVAGSGCTDGITEFPRFESDSEHTSSVRPSLPASVASTCNTAIGPRPSPWSVAVGKARPPWGSEGDDLELPLGLGASAFLAIKQDIAWLPPASPAGSRALGEVVDPSGTSVQAPSSREGVSGSREPEEEAADDDLDKLLHTLLQTNHSCSSRRRREPMPRALQSPSPHSTFQGRNYMGGLTLSDREDDSDKEALFVSASSGDRSGHWQCPRQEHSLRASCPTTPVSPCFVVGAPAPELVVKAPLCPAPVLVVGLRGSGASPSGKDLDGGPSLSKLSRLVLQSYAAVNVGLTYGQPPESLGVSHILKVFDGQSMQGSQVPEVRWLVDRRELFELTIQAFRYAVKVTLDCAVLAEDANDMTDAELELQLAELDTMWHVGVEGSAQWKCAMKDRRPHLMALGRKSGSGEMQLTRLVLKRSDVGVGQLKSVAVDSIWASASVELRYFANDDEERYSIQAHPTLLRNLIVQSAEYPVYVSKPTMIWM